MQTHVPAPLQHTERLAIAAHLHVLMRRKIGRVTDTEWLLRSPAYAREMIALALAQPEHTDLHEWARKLEAALFGPGQPVPTEPDALLTQGLKAQARRLAFAAPAPVAAPAPANADVPTSAQREALASRYIGRLR